MKTLTHCPKCHGPLLSEYTGNKGLSLLWKKIAVVLLIIDFTAGVALVMKINYMTCKFL